MPTAACLSELCVLNDKHTPALGQHSWHGFSAQSRLVTLQLQTAHPHNHSTASPVYETVLKTHRHTQKVATLDTFLLGQCVCGDWWRYLWTHKNGNAEKTAVCLLQLNMQQLWGTVRKGLGDWTVCVWMYVYLRVEPYGCVCVCVWANAMAWEGDTANRTSGLVTALINLPLGHKSPALHSPFPHSHLHSGTGSRLLQVSSQKAHHSPSGNTGHGYIYCI